MAQNSELQLPKIVPASPVAQTFMRYGEIPMDYSTGVPNIQIPLFTMEGRKLSVPISISYHASGIKVNDIASEVGLGWALNCGGMVSRSVNGIRDEIKTGTRTFFNSDELYDSLLIAAPIWHAPSTSLSGIMNFERFLTETMNTYEDPMNDRYFYKLPAGGSGGFTYSYHDMADDSVITLPYRPLKIEKYVSNNKIDGFKITDENGTVYTFQAYLSNPYILSEWYLSEMISADATDTIKFNYITQTANTSVFLRSHTYSGPAKDIVGLYCYPENSLSSMNTSNSPLPGFNTPVLSSIVSSKAIVNFVYGTRDDFTYLKRLVEITVAPKNSPNDPIKRFEFTPKYFGSINDNNRRLGLDKLIISSPGDNRPQQYVFSYESTTLPPYPINMTLPKYSEDFWGYYNGANSNSLIPSDFITNSYDRQSFGGNRDPDPTDYYSKACMLKEIIYPTGGRTVFQFERHFAENIFPYKSDPAHRNGYVGGFRVQSITNFSDANEVANIKTFKYKYPQVKQITKNHFAYDQKYATETLQEGGPESPGGTCWSNYSREVVYSSSFLPLEVIPGLPVMYLEVEEYNGTQSLNAGKTVYSYKQPPIIPVSFPFFEHPNQFDGGNYVPELLSKSHYAFNGTGYYPVSKDENIYTTLHIKESNTGIKLTRTKIYDRPEYFMFSACDGTYPCDLQPAISEYINSVYSVDTKAFQGVSMVSVSKSYSYSPLDSTKFLQTTSLHEYNEQTLALEKKTTISSDGDELKTEYKYPHDYNLQEPYTTMVAKNILSPILSQSNFNSSLLLSKVETKYRNWGFNIIEPEFVQTQIGNTGQLENRINYLSYDALGNVTSVQRTDDNPISYLWGYNRTLPIGMVTGSKRTVFSENWSENFSYIGTTINNQLHSLNGNVTFPKSVNVSIECTFYKSNNHEAQFTINIYNSGNTLVHSFSNVMLYSLTQMSVSHQLVLPSGSYTAKAIVSHQSGSYVHEIFVNMSGTAIVQSEIPFHTSFEEDSDQVSSAFSKTGNKSHVGSYAVFIPPVPIGYGKLVISYWGKSGSAGQWTFVEQSVTPGSLGSQVTIGGSFTYIDDVRMYPERSQMTTYTYDPGIGITSQTDANNETIYYEYDEFNRLKNIRDKDKNVVTTYNYNYKGQ